MTQFNPSLTLTRLIVVRAQERVYDERFHKGVNIIRGINSSGKSMIANLIFYVLGGEGVDWIEEVLLCESVLAEVLVNGIPLTLQRDISTQRERPMRIFWGDFESAEKGDPTAWQLFPFASRGESQSFSQVLFRALDIPEVRGELAARVTMNQLLRLMFADQSTPSDEMYRHEEFTRKDTLDAVGALLCGIYDERIYEIGFLLREKQSERDQIHGQLKALWQLLGTTDQADGLRFLKQQLINAREQLTTAYKQLEDKRSGRWVARSNDEKHQRIQALANELSAVNKELVQLEQELRTVTFEIEDSSQFISALESNRDALNESSATRAALGEISFSFCPSCFNEVSGESRDSCALCKSPTAKRGPDAQLLRLRQELSQQIRESSRLQQARIGRRAEIAELLPTKHAQKRELTLRYNDLATSVTTTLEDVLAQDYQDIGYLTRQIEDLEKQVELARTIDTLENRKADLEAEISRLSDERAMRSTVKERNEADAYSIIKKHVAYLLNHDDPLEDAFLNARPEDIDFSFAENVIKVEGRTNFSASSKVVLKNAFHLALLLASTEKEFFRYPRFALFDNIEDKGMTPHRSHNFQRLIVEMSGNAPTEHQIIFTTSLIDEELDTAELTVGEFYRPDHKSLRIQSGIKHSDLESLMSD